jgi:hypothetical protein
MQKEQPHELFIFFFSHFSLTGNPVFVRRNASPLAFFSRTRAKGIFPFKRVCGSGYP